MMRPRTRAYDFCGVSISSERALPDLRPRKEGRAECAITFAPHPPPETPPEWFQTWRLPGGKLWLSIGRVPAGYLLRFPGQADFVVRADGARIAVHAPDALPPETLRHLLIDQVLPLAMSRRGRLTLHASAVHRPRIGTVAFLGDTGRGKSTLAAALAARGGRIVTDDCLALEMVGGAVHAVPGYPGLRLWPGAGANPLLRGAPASRVAHYSAKRRLPRGALAFRGRPSPVRVLFLLSARADAGPSLAVRQCRAPARLMGLLRFAYVLDVEDRAGLTGLFDGLATLATTVPVRRLRLRHGHNRLPEVADLIRAYAAGVVHPRRPASDGCPA
jgi:hypothetical protein